MAITSGEIYKDTVLGDVRGRPPPGMDWTKGGACIGTPIAIARRGVPQWHLLSGEYIGRLDVYNELGNKGEALFRIRAPQPGGKLEVSLVGESAEELTEKFTYPLEEYTIRVRVLSGDGQEDVKFLTLASPGS